MPEYLAPGVYVEDVLNGARPIGVVSISGAAFFGCVPDPAAPIRKPTSLKSYGEFERVFARSDPALSFVLRNAVEGYFRNGGMRLHIVNLGLEADTVHLADVDLISSIEGISLIAAPGFTDAISHETLITACEAQSHLFAVLDLVDTGADINKLATPATGGGVRPRNSHSGCAAAYAPWLRVKDTGTGFATDCPPSGHICGVYAAMDARRGVHKAPANVSIRGAIALTKAYSDIDQEVLNPAGVNLIRKFHDGIRIWGARTLSESTGEWRYVPVRRLATMIEYSVRNGLRWVVFEPNDAALWKSIRRDVSAFLHTQWRSGALAGTTQEEAYFVKCGADTTTQSDIDMGRVNVQIGFAPLRPAEFLTVMITLTSDA